MDAGCQYRSRTNSTPTYDYYYTPCARPKTSDGNAPPFSIPRLRFPPRPDVTYRCEPTSPEPMIPHWQRPSPNPPSSSWVREDSFCKPVVHGKQSIEAWVDEQIHLSDRSNYSERRGVGVGGVPKLAPGQPQAMGKEELRQRMWDELVYEYEAEAHKWMNHEAEMRRRAQDREREEARRRVVQEDIRRIQARVRQRRDSERQAIAEERRRNMEKAKEKARRDQVRAERVVLEAWQAYESRWAAIILTSGVTLASSSESLGFRDIPWPLVVPPKGVEDFVPERIADFLLHPAHSVDHSRRERVRNALLRWHPDRFRRVLNRVVEEEKQEVEEAVGIVARCLNELLAREGKALIQQAR